MIVYIETIIKRTFGRIPDDPDWFAWDRTDASRIGSFTETITTYDRFVCMYPSDADRELLLRRRRLIDLYTDKTVWFDVKVIQFEDYDFEMIKLREFERKFAL